MTNPGNAVGTNAAFGGRTSVNAFNDALSAFEGRGRLSGWACEPNQGMTISLGGKSQVRDVAIAEDDNGNRVTVNNISEQPIDITLKAAPTLGQRIDLVVAYVNNPPEGTDSAMDNPGACGIITVEGSVVANNPTAPTEQDIRTAIGADGGVSETAYYVVLATIAINEGMTEVTSTDIVDGDDVGLGAVSSALDKINGERI